MKRPCEALGVGLLAIAAIFASHGEAKVPAKPDLTPRAGLWRLEGASEGAELCVLRLSAEETIGGRGATVTGHCATDYPWTGDIMAWRTDPARGVPATIILANAERHTIARFVLADSGEVYTAAVGGEDYALYPPVPVKPGKKKGHK